MTRWAPLIAALLAASPAAAQCLGFQCPNVVGAGNSATAPPIDGFTTPTGAYGFRKLKGTYSGSAIRIRRASDSTETDIGFLGGTGFTGAPWDEAAAAAFCAATTCFGRTSYDQSGAARNRVQTTTANQPQLIFNCRNSLPCWRYTTATMTFATAGAVTPATGVESFSVVFSRSVGTGACTFLRIGNANRIQATALANTWALAPSGFNATATDAVWHTAEAVINTASSVINVDGVETTGSATGNTTASFISTVGAAATTCDEIEAIVWDNYVLTAAERTFLTNNQRSYIGP